MLDMTYEKYIGDLFRMRYNGADLPDYFYVLEVSGRSISPNEIQSLTVTGKDGSYIQGKRKPGLPLKVKVVIRLESAYGLRRAIDELNGILDTDEEVPIVFSDEPNKTYYGMMNKINEGIEVGGTHIVTITFFRSDPYKYGEEQTYKFTEDAGIIENNGTAEADPIIELEAIKPVTFALVSNGDKYNMIGKPFNIDQIPTEKYPRLLRENGSDTTGWTYLPGGKFIDDGVLGGMVGGSIKSNGYAFYANSFGDNPNGWVGPAIRRSFSQSKQDFKITADLESLNKGDGVGKIVVALLDADDNIVASMGIVDATNQYANNKVYFRLGGKHTIHEEGGAVYRVYNNSRVYLEITRIGQRFSVRAFERLEDGRLTSRSGEVFDDGQNKYQAPIRQALIYIAKARHYPTFSMYMHGLSVFGVNDLSQNQIPYIAQTGDIITFDHVESDYRINGESRMDLKKSLGGDFFKLQPGKNSLAFHPSDAFLKKLRFRERFR